MILSTNAQIVNEIDTIYQFDPIPEINIYIPESILTPAESIGADKLWPGGSTGLDVDGEDLLAGMWEAGSNTEIDITNSNLYFSGTTISRASNIDANSVSSHATTVAINLASNGTTGDKGVAFKAEIKNYDLTSRFSEMNTAAITNPKLKSSGILVANHSHANTAGWGANYGTGYGCITNNSGWWGVKQVSISEDFKFGQYSNAYNIWDDDYDKTSYDYPYLTIVKAAGNERGESKPAPYDRWSTADGGVNWTVDCALTTNVPEIDGGTDGYDCIPAGSTFKNALIVGACQNLSSTYSSSSDIVLRSSSSIGPVDDGRIKPDIVAPGAATSYSTPIVSGTVLLLQEAFFNENSQFMLSSSVRGLICHTAFEAGSNPGPDYKHGWGMINAEQAGLFIKNNGTSTLLVEDTLLNQDTAHFYFYSDVANSEAIITLAWTDKEGTPVTLNYTTNNLNNRTSMLVNDLDVVFYELCDGALKYPYTLDYDNPADAPVKQINNVDNIEKIEESGLGVGWYGVRITHKGTLVDGKQAFSLLMSGLKIPNYWNGHKWSAGVPDATAQHLAFLEDYTHSDIQGFSVQDLVIAPNKKITLMETTAELSCYGDIYSFNSKISGVGDFATKGVTKLCGLLKILLQ